MDNLIIIKLEYFDSLYDKLIDLIVKYCNNNKSEYITYIQDIRQNSITKILANLSFGKSEIDWIIASSRGIHQYFDYQNRNNFDSIFFSEFEYLMDKMSDTRKEIEDLKV